MIPGYFTTWDLISADFFLSLKDSVWAVIYLIIIFQPVSAQLCFYYRQQNRNIHSVFLDDLLM